MRRNRFLWVALPALTAVSAFLVSRAFNQPLLLADSSPYADYQPAVHLGDQEEGKVVIGQFRVKNAGRSLLRLEEFVSSCGCTTIEAEQDGRRYAVKWADIAPGGTQEFFVRWSVRGPIGSQQRSAVTFHTNDPQHPEGRVEFLVRAVLGGVSAIPAQALFGAPVVGETVQQVVEIRDRASTARAIDRIVTPPLPDGITVRLINGHHQTPPPQDDDPALGRVIGAVEVTVCCPRPGSFSGTVAAFAEGGEQPLIEFPLSGEIVPAVRLFPPVLVLPRQTSTGLTYGGSVLCRSQKATPLEITFPKARDGLELSVDTVGEDPSTKLIRVELKGSAPAGELLIPLTVRSSRDAPATDLMQKIDCRARPAGNVAGGSP